MKARRPVTRLPRGVPVGQLRRNLEAVQRFRLNVVRGALLILFVGLLARLGKLQLIDASAYSAATASRHDGSHTFRGWKGRILDAHGRPLVSSRRVLSVAVDPQEVKNPRLFSRRVAALLDDAMLAPRIEKAIRTAKPTCRHRVIAPLVDADRVVAQLADLTDFVATVNAGYRGLKVEERELRTYANGHYAAHLLGRAPYEAKDGGPTGGHGVESTFLETLKGDELRVDVQKDRRSDRGSRGRCRTALAIDPARITGRDLRLTLDIVVQHYLEGALDSLVEDWSPEFACGVVMDPRTGHILALANRPTFEPSHQAATYNHAVQGLYPPGSIFKPFTVAEALRRGVVTVDERIELPPRRIFRWSHSSRPVNDSHPCGEWDGCGTVLRILSASSNTGAGELIFRIMNVAPPDGYSVDPIIEMFSRLGFDRPTGIEVCGDKKARTGRPQEEWDPLFPVLGFSFGQGVEVSPLRLASCFCAFARDDARVVRPTLLAGQGAARPDLPPVCGSPADLAAIREGLARCVDEGTARKAFADCRYAVAGKTGTGEQPCTPFNFSGFCGFAPRERPRVLVLVVAKVNENHRHRSTEARPFGGAVSGPAAKSVIERTLDYLLAHEGAGAEGEEDR